MYKLLVLDMDDTFLDSRKVILEPVEQGIRNLLYRGVDVTLASGRFPASLWLHAKFLGMRFPLISLNGAAIVDPVTGSPIEKVYIEHEASLKIIKYAKELGVYVQFYGYNNLVVDEINPVNIQWPLNNVVVNPNKELTFDNYRGQANQIQLQPVGDLFRYLKNTDEMMLKAAVIDDNKELVDRAYEEMMTWTELSISRTGPLRFDINAKGVTKKSALEKICRERGISYDEVVAVGDFDNDIGMIKWAGMGVAMGNGNENVKRAADFITETNDNSGVAQVIGRFFTGGIAQ